jgi:hypothetical protein
VWRNSTKMLTPFVKGQVSPFCTHTDTGKNKVKGTAHVTDYQQDGHDDVEHHNRVDQNIAHEIKGNGSVCCVRHDSMGLFFGEQGSSYIRRPPIARKHLEHRAGAEPISSRAKHLLF